MKMKSKYYIDFSGDGDRIKNGVLGPFDKDGIPMVDYNTRYHAAGLSLPGNDAFGVHYTPVTVSIFALSLFDQICLEPSHDLTETKFYQMADWLFDQLEPISPLVSVWHHHFPIPFKAGLPTPYSSGIAQALGVSVLLRAFELSGKPHYLDAATRAFESFYVDIENGGVCSKDNGYVWLEEWPSDPRSHVLNGFMFAILAIYDYLSIVDCARAHELLASVLDTLDSHILEYDAKYGSRYDLLRGLVVSESYHQIHIRLLGTISSLCGNQRLGVIADRWEGYLLVHGSLKRRLMGFAENIYQDSEYRVCKVRQLVRRFSF